MVHSGISSIVRVCSVLALFGAGTLWACKYSVRDVGFVDLTESNYALHLLVGKSASAAQIQDAQTIAKATFLESNISFELIQEGNASDAESWRMASSLGIDTFPAALLRSPDGAALRLPVGPSESGVVPEEGLWTLMEATVDSPQRMKLLDVLLDVFAVVVFLESEDDAQNRMVKTAIDDANEAIRGLMPSMPKPVDRGPEVLTIPSKDRTEERVFLWSLGFDLDLTEEPQVAILIGRGRRLGPVLEGGLITRTKLHQMMALIGQDCECDLDRSWMQGPMIPLRWDSDRQKLAYDKLAFDPENPLVKAEISRILARGPNARGVASGGGPTSDALLMGYREEIIDVPASSDVAAEPDHLVEPEELTSSKTELAAANGDEAPPTASSAEIPWTLLSVIGIGVVALVGGAVVIVRGPGI